MKKTSKSVSGSKQPMEATMVNLFVSNGSRTSVINVKNFNTRNVYKALRDEKFLPSESVGKTTSEMSEDGKALVVSFKAISVEVEVIEADIVSDNEVFLTATPEQQAAASGNSYGLSTNFGLVSKGELYFMEFDEDSKKSKMVGAECHTGAFLAQQTKREAKRAAQIAKSKEIHNLEVIKTLKKLKIDVKGMDKELLALIAEQALDLETAGNAYLHNDGQDEVKVQVQRFNPESGRWYNAKTRDGRSMSVFFPVESIFEYDVDGRIVGMKTMDHGQTAVAHTIEEDFGTVCVHNYHYVDKATNELVFKSIEQRFIVTGKSINSDAVINGEQLDTTEANTNWGVSRKKKVLYKRFRFNGYKNLTDIGEGFYLMPSEQELTGADLQSEEYSEGIVLGTSVGTATMSLDEQAKAHIKSEKQEAAHLNQISKDESRKANTKVKTPAELAKDLKATELYSWVMDRKEDTFKALKNAALQARLNLELTGMKDHAPEILEILKLIATETGSGFAKPSWIVVNAFAKRPAKDENKASEADFRANVKSHILSNIDAINNGSLTVAELHDEVIAEIYEVCKKGIKSGVCIKDTATAIQMRDIAQKINPVALPMSKGPRNSSVRDIKVS